MLNNLCRIGMDMLKNRWWQWIAGGLLGLLLLTLLTRCSSIQDDIQGRAQTALDANNMSWAKVNLQDRGRDALLSGEAPSEAARDQAIDTVQNLYGTRVVDHDITLKQYVSSTLDLKLDEDKVVLSGTLPDQATIDDTVSQVQGIYGADNVTNNLVASDSARKPVWLAGVAGLLPTLAATRNMVLSANDDAVTVSGDVETTELRDTNLGLMGTAFGEKLNAAIEVVKTGPTEEELAAIAAEEARKLAEKERLAAEAEAARKAEEERIAAEAARKATEAEEARLAAEAARKAEAAEQARIAAEAARKVKAARLAADAARKAAAAEKARLAAALAAEEQAKQRQMMAMQMHQFRMANRRKIIIVQPMFPVKYDAQTMPALTQQNNQSTQMMLSCEQALNRLVSSNPAPFTEGSAAMQQSSQALFGQLNMQIRYCGGLMKQNEAHISVAASASDADLSQQRAQAAIDQLHNSFGIPADLLSVNTEPGEMSGDAQLNFTIKQ